MNGKHADSATAFAAPIKRMSLHRETVKNLGVRSKLRTGSSGGNDTYGGNCSHCPSPTARSKPPVLQD